MTAVARAFVPGHVTGFFTVDRDDDPTKAGSRGAGLALSEGVTVTVRHADDRDVVLNGESVEIEAVERVLDALQATVRVHGVTDLPVGSGFGVSGATALGAALATNDLLDRRLSTYELATVAHGAEVQAGTGLGDVVAQLHGGVPIRLEPGSPQVNRMDAVPARSRVEFQTFGELPTSEVIGGDTEAISTAGERALSALVEEPTLSMFMGASRQFSREADLVSDRVYEVVTDVAEAGGEAAMGMLGQTVVALGTGLSDAGYDPSVCRIDPTGATLVDPPSDRSLPE
ncbi:pantoate kinase [Halosimplex salinum]|uniref:pantoate kinase n=1 Tax=Halosimplex salinum TaxID=1710538 RepID=UPI000F4808E8|nr:pantoate kinase [Halosimplex salinum]